MYVLIIVNLSQAVNTVVAGILHDVIDDTLENLRTIEKEFGDDVAHLVAGVSKLSYINQACTRSLIFFFKCKYLSGITLHFLHTPRTPIALNAGELAKMYKC